MKYDFRDRLREIMARRGYTDRMLEEATGISRRAMHFWKDGKYPDVRNLIILADELQVSTDELLGLDSGRDLLAEAFADARLAGCKTCRFAQNYTGADWVCVRQDYGPYPTKGLTCWEWRGYAKTGKDDA